MSDYVVRVQQYKDRAVLMEHSISTALPFNRRRTTPFASKAGYILKFKSADRTRLSRCRLRNSDKSILEDIQSLLQLFVSNAEGHKYAQDVIIHTGFNQQQTAMMCRRQDIAGRV